MKFHAEGEICKRGKKNGTNYSEQENLLVKILLADLKMFLLEKIRTEAKKTIIASVITELSRLYKIRPDCTATIKAVFL